MHTPRRPDKAALIPGPERLLIDRDDILDPLSIGDWVPHVDICQTDRSIIIRVELPGVKARDISASLENNRLRLRGVKRKPMHPQKLIGYYCMERRYGRFDRTVPVESIVNPRAARASLECGILTIELPKLEDRRGKRIEINLDLA